MHDRPRVAGPPLPPRRPAVGHRIHHLLALQRLAGNAAVTAAVQRDDYQPDKLGIGDKERGGRLGAAIGPGASALGSEVGAPLNQLGKAAKGKFTTPFTGKVASGEHDSYGIGANTAAAGAVTTEVSAVAGLAGNAFTMAAKIGEARVAHADVGHARTAGGGMWKSAAKRTRKMKGWDAGYAGGKMVTQDAGKITTSAIGLAKVTGDLSGATASTATATAGAVTGGVALPLTVLLAIRDIRKLVTQGQRLDRLRSYLSSDTVTENVASAQTDLSTFSAQVLDLERQLGLARASLPNLDREVLRAESAVNIGRVTRRNNVAILAAREEVAQALADLDAAKQGIVELERVLADAKRLKSAAEAGLKIMNDAVRTAAEVVKALETGGKPTLPEIVAYATMKNAKGTARKVVKVISAGLGVAAGVCSLIALASGPGAMVLGPIAVALGATSAALGLAIAGQQAWRYLSKRWRMTGKAVVEAPDGTLDARPDANATETKSYRGLTTWERVKRTVWTSSRSDAKKLMGIRDGAAGPILYEIKSHRKLIAEALYDYATKPEHGKDVNEEARDVIYALTKRQLGTGKYTLVADADEDTKKKERSTIVALISDKMKSTA